MCVTSSTKLINLVRKFNANRQLKKQIKYDNYYNNSIEQIDFIFTKIGIANIHKTKIGICNKCGNDIMSDDNYCRKCGEKTRRE